MVRRLCPSKNLHIVSADTFLLQASRPKCHQVNMEILSALTSEQIAGHSNQNLDSPIRRKSWTLIYMQVPGFLQITLRSIRATAIAHNCHLPLCRRTLVIPSGEAYGPHLIRPGMVSTNGGPYNSRESNSRLGGTISVPLPARQSIKFA